MKPRLHLVWKPSDTQQLIEAAKRHHPATLPAAEPLADVIDLNAHRSRTR